MNTSFTEGLLQRKAEAARTYRGQHSGSLDGFDAFWSKLEPEVLIAVADSIGTQQAAAADTSAQIERAKATGRAKLSDADKIAFIKQHGQDAYLSLPA